MKGDRLPQTGEQGGLGKKIGRGGGKRGDAERELKLPFRTMKFGASARKRSDEAGAQGDKLFCRATKASILCCLK